MNRDIDVYFPEYDWIVRNVQYGNFKKGNIKCPYKPSICGIGYIGEGEYKVSENGKQTKCYNVWYDMMQRCYDTNGGNICRGIGTSDSFHGTFLIFRRQHQDEFMLWC